MKNKKLEIFSRICTAIIKSLFELLDTKHDLDAVALYKYDTVKYLVDNPKELLERLEMMLMYQELAATVDYNRDILEISDQEVDWGKPPSSNVKKERIAIFSFGAVQTFEEIIAKLKKIGFRPANIWELNALMPFHPKYTILALGTIGLWDEREVFPAFPALKCNQSKRIISFRIKNSAAFAFPEDLIAAVREI